MRLPTDTMMDNPLNPYGAPQRVPPYKNQNPFDYLGIYNQ